MRDSIFSWACFLFCSLIVPTTPAVPKFTAVGVYDTDAQVNAVDKNALYDPEYSTGSGKHRALILEIDDFSPLIREAFTNSQGGVINFDNGLIEAGQQTDSFGAMFNGKAVLFESVDHIRSDYNSSSRTPISGPGKSPNGGFLAKSTVMGDACSIGGSYELNLKEFGFEPEEHVRVVAGTILGRSNSGKNGEWIMKVTLDNGDIIAASAVVDLSTGNAMDDTFFGAYAPARRYITGVAWVCSSGEFSGLDDLAFIIGASDFSFAPTEVDAELNQSDTMQPSSTHSWNSSDSYGQGNSILFGTEKYPW